MVAVVKLARDSASDGRGAIYTRGEGVGFMLDLAGYMPDRPLHRLRLLEPSFGAGEFLLEAARRLISASKAMAPKADLADCIHAVELHESTFEATRARLAALLSEQGFGAPPRSRLDSAWLRSRGV